MAKTKAPLFSLDATGTLDKTITYKGKKQSNIAQKYSKPGAVNPFESSPRQKDQRSIIRLITIHWQCMSSADKLTWNNAAKDVRFKGTGYHYFLHMAQQNLTQYLGLVGYWSMNYNINDKIPDLSGNGNHGTLSPIYPCDCPILVDSFNKKQGKAIYFNGIDNYLITNTLTPAITKNDSFTLEVLFNSSLLATWRGLISLGAIYHSYSLYATHTIDTPSFYHVLSDDSILQLLGHPILLNKWTHLVITYYSPTNTYKLYQNSNIVRTKTPVLLSKYDSSLVRIGWLHPSVYFNGSLDCVHVYNLALSEEEILKHYQSYNLP